MFAHYVDLAVRSFKRNRLLTALMVLAIALGVGASMTTLTVLVLLSGDPIPHKSSKLFYVQLDPATLDGYTPGEEPAFQVTRYDAEALLRARRADRQAMMTGGSVVVQPEIAGLDPFHAHTRFCSADFFPMFDVPFQYGSGWSAADDDARARVVVLAKELNDKLFGGENSVGKTVRLSETEFRIVGVLKYWRPVPHFYDLNKGDYAEIEQTFVPFSTSRELKLDRNGSMNCWGDAGGDEESLDAPCTWIQFWVEVEDAAKAADYEQFLDNYSSDQRAAGRFERPNNVRFRNVMQWLDHNKVVPSDVRLQAYLAFGFLAVCLLNTVGLLLAKFLRRSSEIGIRRALGASRRAVFTQFLIEAATVGLAGGVLGTALSWLGLWAVRQQPTDYARLAELDVTMLVTTLALAIGSSLIAGVIPAWRACQVAPAIQLKAQ